MSFSFFLSFLQVFESSGLIMASTAVSVMDKCPYGNSYLGFYFSVIPEMGLKV